MGGGGKHLDLRIKRLRFQSKTVSTAIGV